MVTAVSIPSPPAKVNVSPVLKVSLVPVSAERVKLEAAGAEKERFPLPSVVRIFPLEPSVPGKVYVTIPARLSGDLRVMNEVPLLVPSTRLTPLPVEAVLLVQKR